MVNKYFLLSLCQLSTCLFWFSVFWRLLSFPCQHSRSRHELTVAAKKEKKKRNQTYAGSHRKNNILTCAIGSYFEIKYIPERQQLLSGKKLCSAFLFWMTWQYSNFQHRQAFTFLIHYFNMLGQELTKITKSWMETAGSYLFDHFVLRMSLGRIFPFSCFKSINRRQIVMLMESPMFRRNTLNSW